MTAVPNVKIGVNGADVGIFSTTGLAVTGTFSATSTKSFKIDHPLPELTETYSLVHACVESPQADLIYRGKIQLSSGSAVINIDEAAGMTNGTFTLLCGNAQCFTTNESGWNHVRGKVTGNILTIDCQDTTATDLISWMVIGERIDKNMLECETTDENGRVIVELLKPQGVTNETNNSGYHTIDSDSLTSTSP